MTETVITGIERGCGRRKKGGVYAEMPLSQFGSPLESFLFDPIPQINIEALGLSARGVVLQADPVKDRIFIMDWIGASSYPNPTDWLEEVRRFGMSQRLELSKQQYSQLRPDSGIVPVHSRAFMAQDKDRDKYYSNRSAYHYNHLARNSRDWELCPKSIEAHLITSVKEFEISFMCAGLLWEDVILGQPIENTERIVKRTMPSFAYLAGGSLFEGVEYSPGALGYFPISRMVVVADEDDGTHEDKIKKLEGCPIPFDIVKE